MEAAIVKWPEESWRSPSTAPSGVVVNYTAQNMDQVLYSVLKKVWIINKKGSKKSLNIINTVV